MTLATQYAKAFKKALAGGGRTQGELMKGLRAALERRGHQDLLPRIAAELEKLELRERRVPKETPERARTKVLLQLYHHLTRHV